jgi:hypothetical protein
MGIGPAIFSSAGKRSEHYIPGAYSRSAAIPSASGGVSAGNAIVLGKSIGGKPNTIYVFQSLSEAQEVLVGGELLEGVAHAFSPGGGYAPQAIRAMRVNPGTQSSLGLKFGDITVLKLKSWDWGIHTNQLKIMISLDEESAGTYEVTLVHRSEVETIKNIGEESFTLQYTGTGSSVTLSINATTLSLSSDISNESFEVSLADFLTVEELVGRLNDSGYLVAALPSGKNGKTLSTELDTVTALSLSDVPVMITSHFYALFHALEQSRWIGAGNVEKPSVLSPHIMPVLDEYQYFSGGNAGNYGTQEWNDTLSKLEAEDIQIIATPSTDIAVHTLISNHCTAMSNVVNRKERTAFLGGDVGESIEEALGRARGLNSSLVSYCFPSFKASSPLGDGVKTYPASYFGCKCLGMEAAMSVNMPLTWKSVDVVDWNIRLTTGKIEKLIRGGVLVGGITDDGRLAIIRAMTTHQGNELQLCERSMVREDLYMNRDLRVRFSGGIGKPALSSSESDVRMTLKIASDDWRREGMIVPNDTGENIWGTEIRQSGDKMYITFNRYLTAPQNFYFITVNNYVYDSQTTIAV